MKKRKHQSLESNKAPETKKQKHKKHRKSKSHKENEEADEWVVKTPPRILQQEGKQEIEEELFVRTPPRESAEQRDLLGMSWMLRPPPRAQTNPSPPSPDRGGNSAKDNSTKATVVELNPHMATGGVPKEKGILHSARTIEIKQME